MGTYSGPIGAVMKTVVSSIGTLALGALLGTIAMLAIAEPAAQRAPDAESQVLEQLRTPTRYTIVPAERFDRLGGGFRMMARA